MKPCKVLYIAKTATGGSAFSLYHLVKGLDKSRYEPVVLFHAQDHPYIGDKLAEAGIKVMTLKLPRQGVSSSEPVQPVNRRDIRHWLEIHIGRAAGQIYLFLKTCYQFVRWEASKIWPIWRTIQRNGINLVHVNNGLGHSRPEIIAAWLARVPCVCHTRMFSELNHFDKLFVHGVDYFIYISRAIAEDCVTQGIPSAKGTVVHNAVDLHEFLQSYDVTSIRSEFGWGLVERLVGVVGRLDWWKGHEYFLEAIAKVSQQNPHLRGLIIGQPETTPQNQAYFQRLQTLTTSLGLEDKVVFTGFRTDVPRLMAALDVVVLSSAAPEPFGRVVIEGMAAAKPVVATAAGGVLDIITDRVDGLLIPGKDAQAMAQAILWLLSNKEQAEQIGRTARQRVAEKFTVPYQVAAMQKIYDTVLNQAQGGLIPAELKGIQ